MFDAGLGRWAGRLHWRLPSSQPESVGWFGHSHLVLSYIALKALSHLVLPLKSPRIESRNGRPTQTLLKITKSLRFVSRHLRSHDICPRDICRLTTRNSPEVDRWSVLYRDAFLRASHDHHRSAYSFPYKMSCILIY